MNPVFCSVQVPVILPQFYFCFFPGFYSVSGSSLSDSCYSVASEAAPGGPVKMGGPCRPHSLDHSTTQWREDEQRSVKDSGGTVRKGVRRPASTGILSVPNYL